MSLLSRLFICLIVIRLLLFTVFFLVSLAHLFEIDCRVTRPASLLIGPQTPLWIILLQIPFGTGAGLG